MAWPCHDRPSVQVALQEANLVVVGRVLASKDYNQRGLVTGNTRSTWRMHRVVVQVLRGWKGAPRDTIILDTPPPDEDSGTARFQVNELYLLYLRSITDTDQPPRADTVTRIADLLRNSPDLVRCSRTAPLSAAAQDLAFLGEPKWVRP
jgi:hypothetical protein